MISANIQLTRGDFTLNAAFQTASRITGVFGPSGAGKTTLINAITGLEKPDSGSIAIDGEMVFDRARSIDVPVHRRRIGVVFQEHRLFPHLSVKSNLLYGSPARTRDFTPIVDLLEINPLLDRGISQLSGGERQRIALGRALLSQPRVLLLDEPLASLDLRLKEQIIPYLQRVRDETPIPMLYVSHDLTEILQLTDELLVLDRGRLIGHGRYGEIIHQDATLRVMHERGLKNVLPMRIISHHADQGVSMLAFDAATNRESNSPPHRLIAPLCAAPIGALVRIAIQPWEIALAAGEIERVSIQNQIAGVVTRCSAHDQFVLVEVDVGAPFFVEVSGASASSLHIGPGQPICCLIKTRAIRYVGTPVH